MTFKSIFPGRRRLLRNASESAKATSSLTQEELRQEAARLLDNMAAVEMEDVSEKHVDCFECRQANLNASVLRMAAAALRDPPRMLL